MGLGLIENSYSVGKKYIRVFIWGDRDRYGDYLRDRSRRPKGGGGSHEVEIVFVIE